MTLSFGRWVSEEIERRDLDGFARDRAEDELRHDPTLSALWAAMSESDERQSALRTWDDDTEPVDVIDALGDARQACDDALDQLADEVIRETVTDVNVHGHSVDLRHAIDVDCPACEERVEAFHLGSADGDRDGWVCGHCGATIETDRDGDVVEVSEA